MESNYEKGFLDRYGTFNYNGVLVTRLIGGWEVFGKKVSTKEEVDEVIQNTCGQWDVLTCLGI